ncbi:hypothetical protein SAMN05216386_0087 [Nitrosospira briensis]|uniref:Uncharacterized protein n=1 Tax=Nitrosospira briensis TaxID=35799 RepID=A0A1I4XFY0_9PROT|nr:hypothetical protein [Nitrosospira briensis]SFN24436.1 hypothetical protein SAMN05216386_0087 [Nitrosospira briensis]
MVKNRANCQAGQFDWGNVLALEYFSALSDLRKIVIDGRDLRGENGLCHAEILATVGGESAKLRTAFWKF